VSISTKIYKALTSNLNKTPASNPSDWAEQTGGLRIYGTYDVVDLTASASPLLEAGWHTVLAYGLVPFVFQSKGMIQEKNDAQVKYEQEKTKMLRLLSERNLSPIERIAPNTANYE